MLTHDQLNTHRLVVPIVFSWNCLFLFVQRDMVTVEASWRIIIIMIIARRHSLLRTHLQVPQDGFAWL